MKKNISVWTRGFHVAAALGALLLMFVLCALPARANLVSNGTFTGCNGSLTGGCAPANFAIGTSASGTVYNLTNWNISSTSNLHCVAVGNPVTNSALCGAGWNFGHSSDNLKMFALPGAAPGGGNYVLIDGAAAYSATLSQSVTGLTIGASYTLSFYQSAGQEVLASTGAASIDYWQVAFGGQTKGSASQNSITVQPGSTTSPGWQLVTYTFTATAINQTLSFLSVGSGAPPFLFLTGVDLEPVTSTPEPATVALVLAGLVAIPAARKRLHKRG